jgi:transposase
MSSPQWIFSGALSSPWVGLDTLSRELDDARPADERSGTARPRVVLPEQARTQLERWARSRTIAGRLVVRARIVLLAGAGLDDRAIAREVRVSTRTVRLWCRRFADGGLEAIARDKPGRGRKPRPNPALEARFRALLATTPSRTSRWTTRSLAEALGVSRSTVHRLWTRELARPVVACPLASGGDRQAIHETEAPRASRPALAGALPSFTSDRES